MLLKPRNRSCPSLSCVARSNTRRQLAGLKNGSKPSITNIIAIAPSTRSSTSMPGAAYLRAAGAADAPPDALPRMALKKSLPGSTTITSDLLRKLAR
jgi:hypothetical protein